MSALHVLFKIAGSEYVLPAADVLHMDAFSGATRVPGAPPHVAGIMQTRGRVVPVIDLRLRFGLDPHLATPDSRVVVVKDGARAVALLADSAREVLRIDPGQFRDAPEMVTVAGQGFIKSVAQTGSRLVLLLDLHKLISEEENDA